MADAGISHMLEHMVFKGTARRTAGEIAVALEGLGGSLDAYTSREHTSYQARVLDEHLPQAMDVLADLITGPVIAQRDLDLEREVVREEIAQVDDTPDDLIFELHAEQLWGGHPYGRSILGTHRSVEGMTAEQLRALHRKRYRAKSLIVAAAGHVQHDDVVERVEELFSGCSGGDTLDRIDPPQSTSSGVVHETRQSAQTHILFGTGVPGHSHPDRYPLVLLSSALGSGMSSRLFQRIREELALCYSVYTYQSFYSASGVSGVYLGTRPATAEKAANAVREELAQVAKEGLEEDEIERVKQQVKGHVMLSLESSGSRLHRLAGFALNNEPLTGLNELLSKIDAVTGDDVFRVAKEYFDPAGHLELRLGPEC
jgi:predicted Zn-dependent peptidase